MKNNLENNNDSSQPAAPRRRVLILGGGFGGIYAARRLGRTLGKRQDIEVVLISRENYLLFTPMLHEVAAGDLDPADIVRSLRKMERHVRLVQGEVTAIDLHARAVRYDMGALRQPREITYDYLLLALGADSHFFVKGRVKVSERLEVSGYEGVVWAAGDCAAVPHSDGFHPPTAQHGMREAVTAANNIEAAITGKAPVPFRFSTIGQLASIGRRTGVAQICGLRFSGFVAWWLWRTVYLAKLPGFSKKLRVAIKWSSELLFPREIEQLVTLQDVERLENLCTSLRERRREPEPARESGSLHLAKRR